MPALLHVKVRKVIADAITAANTKFGDYIRNGDAAGLAGLYTKDAVLLPPNMEKVSGRKAIKEFWAGAISQMGLKDATLETKELFGTVSVNNGSPQEFVEIGDYTLAMQPGPRPRIKDKGKYVVVWKYTVEGRTARLELHRDMWNSNMPPPQ